MPRPTRGHTPGHCKDTLRTHPEDTLQDNLRTHPADNFRNTRMQPKDAFQEPSKTHYKCLQDAPPKKSPRTDTPRTHTKTPQGHLTDTPRTHFKDTPPDTTPRTQPKDTFKDTPKTRYGYLWDAPPEESPRTDTLQKAPTGPRRQPADTLRGHTFQDALNTSQDFLRKCTPQPESQSHDTLRTHPRTTKRHTRQQPKDTSSDDPRILPEDMPRPTR